MTAAVHSITSSARASSASGGEAEGLAVLRLMLVHIWWGSARQVSQPSLQDAIDAAGGARLAGETDRRHRSQATVDDE
jgi:hypothetical protein